MNVTKLFVGLGILGVAAFVTRKHWMQPTTKKGKSVKTIPDGESTTVCSTNDNIPVTEQKESKSGNISITINLNGLKDAYGFSIEDSNNPRKVMDLRLKRGQRMVNLSLMSNASHGYNNHNPYGDSDLLNAHLLTF